MKAAAAQLDVILSNENLIRGRMRFVTYIALTCCAALFGCSARESARIALDSDSLPWRPAFTMTGPEAPRIIMVRPSEGQSGRSALPAIWNVVREPGGRAQSPVRIEYGVVPPGYGSSMAAPQLTPGEYEVVAQLTHTSAALRFKVAAGGAVRAP